MSRPVTQKEKDQEQKTQAVMQPTENVASTACPGCHTRFALAAHYSSDGWDLRCTECGWSGKGELK